MSRSLFDIPKPPSSTNQLPRLLLSLPKPGLLLKCLAQSGEIEFILVRFGTSKWEGESGSSLEGVGAQGAYDCYNPASKEGGDGVRVGPG